MSHLITIELNPDAVEKASESSFRDAVILGPSVLKKSLIWPSSINSIARLKDSWGDAEAFEEMALKAESLYGILSESLIVGLESQVKLNWPTRSWQILIDPWVRSFSFAFMEKTSKIELAIKTKKISTISQATTTFEPAQDMREWISQSLDGTMNVYLYQRIANDLGISTRHEPLGITGKQAPNSSRSSSSNFVLARAISKLSGSLGKRNKIFIYSSVLGWPKELLLNFLMRQVPTPRTFEDPLTEIQVDRGAREALFNSSASVLRHSDRNPRVLSALKLASELLPRAYFEGQPKLQDLVRAKNWPERPRLIFDCNGYWADDVFKEYCAEKTAQGSKLVIGQHGGMMGTSRRNDQLTHQLKISDAFISWGWIFPNGDKILPVGMLKPIASIKASKKGPAIMPLLSLSSYPRSAASFPQGAEGLESYFLDQVEFILSLDPRVRENIDVRLYMHDRGDKFLERLSEKGITRIKAAKRPLTRDLRGHRIAIVTYNSTTFLETLACDFPTIAFWNPRVWSENEIAKNAFNLLRSSKILHDSPESASRHLSEIWDYTEDWWNSTEVQASKAEFVNEFAKPLSLRLLANRLLENAR